MQERIQTPALTVRDELIEHHGAYVRALAVEIMRACGSQIDLDELIAYGQIGLIEAAERFDPQRGVLFLTFAHYRIKGAIYDGVRKMGYLSRSDAQTQRATRFAANANDFLCSVADNETEDIERHSAHSLDDEITAAESVISDLIPVYMLSMDSDLVPDLPDESALSMEKIEQQEIIGHLFPIIADLNDGERKLIEALYFRHISMTTLAAEMNISKSWISRLHSRAIRHLRSLMEERGLMRRPV